MTQDNIYGKKPEEIDQLLRKLGYAFDNFANDLARGVIIPLAPPFKDYDTYNGNLIGYYQQFFDKYLHYLDQIDAQTWLFINCAIEAYIEKHRHIKVSFNLLQEVNELIDAIMGGITAYFNGLLSEAYQVMEKAFLRKEKHLLQLIPQIVYQGGSLYRVRGKCNIKDSKELFHTPIELRSKCGSYRYSIVGYPSLYVAGSLDTALKETRITDTNYSAIRFATRGVIQCADLSLPNADLTLWERYALVLFYPLIMACGLKVKNDKDPFKPEYVIPQILFQIISQHSPLMGVSYTSTRYSKPDFRDSLQRNFVFRVPKATQAQGYSKELADLLTCTEPLSPDVNEDVMEVSKRLLKKDCNNSVL